MINSEIPGEHLHYQSPFRQVVPLGRHLGSYFGLTRPGSYLKEWAESQNCTFTGQWDIKTACIETAVKYDKNC